MFALFAFKMSPFWVNDFLCVCQRGLSGGSRCFELAVLGCTNTSTSALVEYTCAIRVVYKKSTTIIATMHIVREKKLYDREVFEIIFFSMYLECGKI